MNYLEYERMASVEDALWWYCGLRDIITKTLQQSRFAIPGSASVLDAGCGTGANLQLLQTLLEPAYLGGFDLSPHAVELAGEKVADADTYISDILNPKLHVDALDLVISCDVICIPGTAAAMDGLVTLVEHLRNGGLFILNLPAYNWLYSEHDIAVHTTQRFTKSEVGALLAELGLSVELITYRVFLLFPAIVLSRLPTILGSKPKLEDAKSDVELPGKWTNALLNSILTTEATAIVNGVRFPWGTSVFAVARKR
jgi:SAM-dependent methyltransferase